MGISEGASQDPLISLIVERERERESGTLLATSLVSVFVLFLCPVCSCY